MSKKGILTGVRDLFSSKKGILTNVRDLFSSKKGFEMQFSWIFILIAGTIILSFFVMLAQKQLVISESKQEIYVWQKFNDVFFSALSGEDVNFVMDTSATLHFHCTNIQCSLKIGKKEQPYDLPIFSPAELNGGPLILWSKTFNSPFHITNLLFISNEKTRFIIVSDANNPLKTYLENNLPQGMNVDFVVNAMNEQYQGHDHVRFVFIDVNPKIHPSFNDAPHSIIKVAGNKVFINNQEYYFTDEHKELLLAALFSENSDMYEIQLKNKIFDRIKDISMILKEKARLNQDLQCYTNLKIFDDLASTADALNNDLSDLTSLTNAEKAIENSQKNCPRLY
ncbi:hypothetical protein COV11_03240 [Candidatus Woesearchaeota archaeon CG10_big_fil_rev_8_21_14_0_10_30_7]|nr:MAG: hypothetical protein COV11_03240 [Candidatus Woesearchaeota archaeon CG10_big_fil_rev_8_21_14_0_10_30_7]